MVMKVRRQGTEEFEDLDPATTLIKVTVNGQEKEMELGKFLTDVAALEARQGELAKLEQINKGRAQFWDLLEKDPTAAIIGIASQFNLPDPYAPPSGSPTTKDDGDMDIDDDALATVLKGLSAKLEELDRKVELSSARTKLEMELDKTTRGSSKFTADEVRQYMAANPETAIKLMEYPSLLEKAQAEDAKRAADSEREALEAQKRDLGVSTQSPINGWELNTGNGKTIGRKGAIEAALAEAGIS
jgi:hypothetical protein